MTALIFHVCKKADWDAALEPARLGSALKWEPSRNGALFPHLYGPLLAEALVWARDLPLGADGRHVFPDLVP